jgi:sterol desaturase/sphingolipid hydroxylase (fatty acid hydroxylase superfamily)
MDLHQRTEQFRDRYRDNISRHYSGWLHGAFVFGVGGALMIYCFSQAQGLQPWHWLLVPAALLFTNVGEYIAHRELGHKKRRWAKLFYSRHTGDHHSFFTHEDYLIDNSRDLRVVLFPAFLLVAVTLLVAAPMGWALGQLLTPGAGWLFAGALLLGYLLYEVVHLCDHLPASNPLTRWPVLRQLREHHRLHHDPDIARQKNFNVTLPVTDWIMGTWYRG